jgi:hypothetical protein
VIRWPKPRRLSKVVRLSVVLAILVLATSAGVFAYFSSHGSASADASVGSVNPPTNVTVTASNNSTSVGPAPVTVAWNAPSSGTTPTSYQVVRDDGSTQTTLGGCGLASCTDSTVGDGTYTYHVMSQYGTSWTSSAADSNQITVQNQVSTTTTLHSSANPSVVGQTVTYTATVNAGSVVPGGTVDFKDGATTICSAKPLAGSSPYTATCDQTYAATSAGHSITAVYSGDSGTLSSTSSAVSQVVNKAVTTTGLASSANPSVVGQTVTFTATVSVTAPGAATPTGTVDFKDGSSTVCSARPLSGSAPFQATCQQTYNSAGTGHSLTAVYSGGSTTAASTSTPAVSQTVNAAATTTTLSSGTNPSVFGQSVTFNVTVSANAPGAGTPTGSVPVKEGSTTVCSVTLSGGSGSCSSSSLSVATHALTAVYAGTTNFGGSTSTPALNQGINKASTTTALASSANPSVTGQQITYTATVAAVSPGAGTPTGTVAFTDNGSAITCAGGSQTLNASRQATCSVAYVASGGTHAHIAATYSGDGSFLTSTSADLSQSVNKAITSTAVASSANPSVTGQPVTYTATVSASSPGTGTSTGTIQFKDGSSTISGCATQTLNGSGVATCVVSSGYDASGGNRTVSAVYSGDGDYNGSTSSNLTQSVGRASTSAAVVSSDLTAVVGQLISYTGTVTVTAPGSGAPAGNIEFLDNNSAISACGGATGVAVDINGNAVCQIAYASPGNHPITVKYLVDPNFGASATSSSITESVAKDTTTTTLVSSANPSVTGQAVTYTVTVIADAPGAGTPTGNVNFTDNGTSISGCGAKALSGGQATCSIAYNAGGGNHTKVDATYAGDSNFLGSTTAADLSQAVNKASTSTSLSSSVSPSVFGQSVTFTATVTATAPGSGTPTGAVNFKDGGATIGTCSVQALNGSAQATCSTSALGTGLHSTITAVYAGDGNFLTSTSSNFGQTVNKASTTTAVGSSNNPAVTGGNTTYTATVAPVSPGAGTPTGTVAFTDGGTTITGCGAVALNGSAQATCSQTSLTTGSHTIVATYSSDTNFSASTSSNLTESVNVFAGIDFVKSAPSGGTFSCDYTTITAVTCSLTGLANGASVSGAVRLVNASHGAVTNTTGSPISVPYSLSGQASGLSPASPQSVATSASATPTISFSLNNGNNKVGTLIATVTLNGATYTVTLTASS